MLLNREMAEGQKRQKVSHTLLPHQTSFLHLVHKRTAPLGKERYFKELDDVYRFAGENGFSAAVGSLLKVWKGMGGERGEDREGN